MVSREKTLTGFFLVFLLFEGLPVRALQQEPMKSKVQSIRVVPQKPTRKEEKQQVILRGVEFSPNVIGIRVFINPGKTEQLSTETRSYIGSIAPSESYKGKPAAGNFTLPVEQNVQGPVMVVIQPITDPGQSTGAGVRIKAVEIRPVPNDVM